MSAVSILALCAQQLAVGLMVGLLLVNQALIGRGFFRFVTLTSAVLLAGSLALAGMAWVTPGVAPERVPAAPGLWTTYALALAGLTALIACQVQLRRGREGLRPLRVAGALGIASLTAAAWMFVPAGPTAVPPRVAVLYPLNLWASTLALGLVTLAMILGHWYLVIKDLSIALLRRLTNAMLLALLVRLALVVMTLALFQRLDIEPAAAVIDNLVRFRDLVLVLGVTGALVAPLILALLVRQTVRMHSTQSATGLLYVAVIMICIGEIILRYVMNVTSIPV